MRARIPEVKIGERAVGDEQPVYIIAEAGVNHNGDLKLALELIDCACEAGADAVKFQSYVTESLITRSAPKAPYQHRTTSENETQFDMLKRLEISEDQHTLLIDRCRERGITFLSTPYDLKSSDLLEKRDVPAFKVASTDTTNLPFLEALACKKRPIILSTGMCSLSEVEEAVFAIRATGNTDIIILQCTSQYPTPIDQVNLNAMEMMKVVFNTPVGFSDHTQGIEVAPWAVAAGASLIEKHFTLDRQLPGPDHAASLEPNELEALIRVLRSAETAMGDGVKRVMECEESTKPTHQKSLVVVQSIFAGEEITEKHLTCKRPGTGLPSRWLSKVVGKKANCDIKEDEILEWTMLSVD